MNLIDRFILMAMVIITAIALRKTLSKHRNSESSHSTYIYHSIAFATFLIVGLGLAVFGWDILGLMGNGLSNKLVAIIASLIPFSWATALVSKYYPRYEKLFAFVMLSGLALISASRFLEMQQFARIIYPVFHSTAGVTVISLPLLAVKNQLAGKNFLWVSIGGFLISMGGISLAFLSAGKQLLFFSEPVVLLILAPLLLITSASYAWGLLIGGAE